MGALDHQLGVADETTYGTLVTPARFFEYNSESISETEGRTEGDPLRSGQHVIRNDRFTPYFSGAAGSISLDVMNKGFGFWLKHMLGVVTTSGVGPFTHTGTVGDLLGDMFTAQVNRPFHPSGTNQPFAYLGGKVASWTLSNTVDANLVCELECDFAAVDTATALAAASYPASMENLTWAGGVVTIGGSAYDVTEISVSGNNGLDVDRRQIRNNTTKKQPTSGRREIEFSLSADFDSMTQRNRARADTRAAALATLSAKWTLGTASLEVSIPAARFDAWEGAVAGPDAITQTLSGVARWDGTASPVSIIYISGDATP